MQTAAAALLLIAAGFLAWRSTLEHPMPPGLAARSSGLPPAAAAASQAAGHEADTSARASVAREASPAPPDPAASQAQAVRTGPLETLPMGRRMVGTEGFGLHLREVWAQGDPSEAKDAANTLHMCRGFEASAGRLHQQAPAGSDVLAGFLQRCQSLTVQDRALEGALLERAARAQAPGGAAGFYDCVHVIEVCAMTVRSPNKEKLADELLMAAVGLGDRQALDAVALFAGERLYADAVQWRAHQIAVAELDRRAGRVSAPPFGWDSEGVRWRTLTAHERLLHKHPGFSADDEARAAALSKAIVERFQAARRP